MQTSDPVWIYAAAIALLFLPLIIARIVRGRTDRLVRKFLELGKKVAPFVPMRNYGPDAFAAGAMAHVLSAPSYALVIGINAATGWRYPGMIMPLMEGSLGAQVAGWLFVRQVAKPTSSSLLLTLIDQYFPAKVS